MAPARHTMKISLDDWQYQVLRETAAQTHKRLSSLIRDIISEKLTTSTAPLRVDPIFSIVGMASGDGTNVAKNHDDVLYGDHL